MYSVRSVQDMNAKVEESTALEAVTRQRLVKTAEWEDLVRAAVKSRVRELTTALQLLAVTACKQSRDSDYLWAARPRGRSSSPGKVKNFLFSTSFRPALGPTQPPIQWVPRALSPGVKRQRCEVDHPASTSAEVKNMWIFTSTPHTPLWRSA
jgi:hypothetical protein